MPNAALRPCRHPGCVQLVGEGGYCAAHKRVAPGSFSDRERGTRQARGYGADWDKRRVRILERDGYLCQECRRQGILKAVGDVKYSAFVDHIVPKCDGGSDDDSNLETLCRACHTRKTDREKNQG
ncbi:MAG: HNH endonuclease, partial [Acidovorax sp.]|nr:HNH endonuclease [Acidovorax sp.]